MKSKMFRRVIAALSAMTMAITMMATSASAVTPIDPQYKDTNGGSNGSVTTYNYVYKEASLASPSGPHLTTYAVYGKISTSSKLTTDWTGSGELKVKNSVTPTKISGSAKNKNSCTVSKVVEGSSPVYVTYSCKMSSYTPAFGSSNYESSGAF